MCTEYSKRLSLWEPLFLIILSHKRFVVLKLGRDCRPGCQPQRRGPDGRVEWTLKYPIAKYKAQSCTESHKNKRTAQTTCKSKICAPAPAVAMPAAVIADAVAVSPSASPPPCHRPHRRSRRPVRHDVGTAHNGTPHNCQRNAARAVAVSGIEPWKVR